MTLVVLAAVVLPPAAFGWGQARGVDDNMGTVLAARLVQVYKARNT